MSALSNELCALRKERKLTVQDIYEKTRIDVKTIESIESGSFFSRTDIGQPYLRSFIRTYARTLGISESDITAAIDQHFNGNYDGLIGQNYLSKPAAAETDKPKVSSRRKNSSQQSLSSDSGFSQKDSTAQQKADPDDHTSSKQPLATSSLDIPKDLDKPNLDLEHNQTLTDRPDLKSVDWVSTVKRAKLPSGNSKMMVGLLAAILILAGIGSAIYFGTASFSFGNNGNNMIAGDTNVSETSEDEGLPALPDSLVNNNDSVRSAGESDSDVDNDESPTQADQTDDAQQSVSLPDELQIVIVASDGVLEPVRVRSDTDNTLRPFWLEEGEGMVVDFSDEVEFRGQFQRMSIYFNGHPVENFTDFIDEDGFVILTREYFQENPHFAEPADEDEYDDITIPENLEELPLF